MLEEQSSSEVILMLPWAFCYCNTEQSVLEENSKKMYEELEVFSMFNGMRGIKDRFLTS